MTESGEKENRWKEVEIKTSFTINGLEMCSHKTTLLTPDQQANRTSAHRGWVSLGSPAHQQEVEMSTEAFSPTQPYCENCLLMSLPQKISLSKISGGKACKTVEKKRSWDGPTRALLPSMTQAGWDLIRLSAISREDIWKTPRTLWRDSEVKRKQGKRLPYRWYD